MNNTLLRTVPGFEKDTLESMIAQKRLYIADYSIISTLQPGSYPIQKFVYAPIGLFGLKKNGR
jgi:hypothetical protein